MTILATIPNENSFTIGTTFREFLNGPVMSRLAILNNTDVCDVLKDYLPDDIEHLDDCELIQCVEEACTMAGAFTSEYVEPAVSIDLHHVLIDEDDLVFFKQRFLPNHGLKLV